MFLTFCIAFICFVFQKVLRPKYKKDIAKKLKPISDYLGKNDYLAGSHVNSCVQFQNITIKMLLNT